MRVFTRDRSFYRTLIALAIPISLQNLITFAVGFADNLMIGRLGDSATLVRCRSRGLSSGSLPRRPGS